MEFAPKLRKKWASMTQSQKQEAYFKNQGVVWDIDYLWVIQFVRLLTLSASQENVIRLYAVNQLIEEKKEYKRRIAR